MDGFGYDDDELYSGKSFNIFQRKKNRNKQHRRPNNIPIVDLGMNDSHVPPIDTYINVELQPPQVTDSGQQYAMCRCTERPTTCICFKRPCVMHRNDGTKYTKYVTPPPSPILRHNIGFWSVGDDDYVYIRVDDKNIIRSKIK